MNREQFIAQLARLLQDLRRQNGRKPFAIIRNILTMPGRKTRMP